MPKLLITGAAGLYSSISDFVKPPNSLNEANNILLRDGGVIESRRGMLRQPSGYDVAGTFDHPGVLTLFGDTLYWLQTSGVYYDTGSGWTNVATTVGGNDIDAKGLGGGRGFHQNAVEFMQNLYVSSNSGVYMTDTVGNQLFKSGFDTPAPLLNATLKTTDGAWTWAGGAATAKVAYRVVWGRKDAHKRIILSEPSGRTIVENATGAVRFVTGDVPTIPECSSSTFYQVYRSVSVDSSQATVSPDNNMYQVFEGLGADVLTIDIGQATRPNASSIVTVTHAGHGFQSGMKVTFAYNAADVGANKLALGTFEVTVTSPSIFTYDQVAVGTAYANTIAGTGTVKYYPFTDPNPDLNLTVPLYTNAVDSPEPEPNQQPPACLDIAVWKNRLWFSGTNAQHTVVLSLLGVYVGGGPSSNHPDGLHAGDKLTVNGMDFVAVAGTPTAGSLEFKVTTSSAYPSVNIRETVLSLVNAINTYTSNTTVRANYLSGETDAPGALVIRTLKQNAASFIVTPDRPSAWSPFVPNGITSTNDAFDNRLFFSKPNQPEAVPALNYMDVGAGNRAILRIIPVKDKLFVLKEDGVFEVSGDYPFRLDLVDSKTILTDWKAAVGGESCLYGLFNSGICRIDSNGVKNISAPIADELRQLNSDNDFSILSSINETDGLVLFRIYSKNNIRAVWFCYNIRTNAWTNWDFDSGNYPFLVTLGGVEIGVDSMAFVRPSFAQNARLCFTFQKSGGTASLAKEIRFNDANNYNLQFIDGAFTEATATANGAVTGCTLGVSKTLTINAVFGTDPVVGDIIYGGPLTNFESDEPSSDDFFGLITTIDATKKIFTVKQMGYYSSGTVSNGATVRLLRAFPVRVSYDMNSPSNTRHYRDVTYMFNKFLVNAPESFITTDQNSTEVNSTISFSDTNTANMRFKRILFPSGHQYANSLSVGLQSSEAGTYFKLLGIGLTYEDVSERNSK